MIKSIDELESADIKKLKALCRHTDPDTLAIAMHGISPTLAERFNGSMSIFMKLQVWLSPYKRKAVKLDLVEKSHRDIVSVFNNLKEPD